jgi:hypothetical protein
MTNDFAADFMIRLRQVAIDIPVSNSSGKAVPPPPQNITTAPVNLPTVRKSYTVPAGLLLQPNDDHPPAEGRESKAKSRKLGKSKYVLCRAETFRGLGKKKGKSTGRNGWACSCMTRQTPSDHAFFSIDRKALGADAEMSPAIVDQITSQLQTRVVQEVHRFCWANATRISGHNRSLAEVTAGTKSSGLRPISRKDMEMLWQGSPLPASEGRALYAIIDLCRVGESSPALTPGKSTGTTTWSLPSYPDMPVVYPPSSPSDTAAAPFPVFRLERMFTADMHEAIDLALQPLLSTGSAKAAAVALLSTNEIDSESRPSATAESGRCDDVTRLFVALWRLRLWYGYGWTVSGPADSAMQGAEEETSRGCILQGFKSVQGVFHTKWP